MARDGAASEFRAAELAGKYLTFALSAEEYGLPVLKVREIIKMMDITAVPQVPGHVKGVVNLRGKVIPVVDLRVKFGLGSQDYTDRTCIIVVEVVMLASRVMMGIIVDHVSEVLNIVGKHCVMCHSAAAAHEGYVEAPKGVAFDTPEEIRAHAAQIRQQAVLSDIMPLGNETGMTVDERQALGAWIAAGAPLR